MAVLTNPITQEEQEQLATDVLGLIYPATDSGPLFDMIAGSDFWDRTIDPVYEGSGP